MLLARRWPLILGVAGTLAGCGGTTPTLEAVVLAPPFDTIPTPYVEVTQAAWVGNNRWAVVAPNEGIVGLVDFDADSFRPLGGTQNDALRNPSTVFTLGDTLYVGDWGLRQLTLWTVDGRLVRSISASDVIRGALPRARDAAGRFYVELAPRAGSGGARDSGAVARTGATLDRGDTVARLAPLDLAEIFSEGRRRLERRVFSGTDAWGVLPDGSVWIARFYHNRVDWRAPDGQWITGQALPDRVLEVTRYDREMFIRKFPPELRSTARQLPFAPIKPPFEAAFTATDSVVWLVKSRAPVDSAGRYHVIDRQGRLARDLRVPGQARVIGATRETAIAVEPMRGGARLLQFSLPPLKTEDAGAR